MNFLLWTKTPGCPSCFCLSSLSSYLLFFIHLSKNIFTVSYHKYVALSIFQGYPHCSIEISYCDHIFNVGNGVLHSMAQDSLWPNSVAKRYATQNPPNVSQNPKIPRRSPHCPNMSHESFQKLPRPLWIENSLKVYLYASTLALVSTRIFWKPLRDYHRSPNSFKGMGWLPTLNPQPLFFSPWVNIMKLMHQFFGVLSSDCLYLAVFLLRLAWGSELLLFWFSWWLGYFLAAW